MPQNGFHGLFGLATAKAIARSAPEGDVQPFVTGIVLGSMLPDIDMYPTGVAVLLKHPDLIYIIHRTATHSLLFALVLLFLAAPIPRWRWAFLGLAIGVGTHIFLDVFFWFTQIDLFWPFSRMNLGLPVVNLWSHESLPSLWVNIREAFEYAAFALLLRSLRRISLSESLLKWERALWICFAIAMATAFLFRDAPSKQNYVVTTPYLLLFLPYCWWQVWRLRSEIARWARSEEAVRLS